MKKWRIQTKSIVDLVPHPKNPRQFTEKGMKDLGRSIDAFGLAEPIVVNSDDTIIGGHARVMVLKQRGETECECYVPNRQLSEKEVEQLMIRLNANQAGVWDTERLANEWDLSELMDWGLDLSEFRNLEAQEDDYEIPADIVTNIKLGDIFQIGENRLMCGDSVNAEDVEKLMGGEKCDMVFTDPPYGVNYGADQELLQKKTGGKLSRSRSSIINDNFSAKELSEKLWRPTFKNLYDYAKDDCSFYMTMCQGGDQMMMMMMMSEHWQIKHELIWVKSSPVFSMGRLDYDYQHEPILYGWKKKHNWYGKGEFLKSIWEIPKPSKSDLHPTMKPIALIGNCLLNSSKENDLIVDLFLGSGSTMVAAQQLNRRCFGMEISPQYCQVIIDRMKKSFPEIEIQQIN